MSRILKSLLIICICTAIGLSAAAQQDTGKSGADLLSMLEKSDNDTSKVNILLQLSGHFFWKSPASESDRKTSLLYVRAAEKLSNELSYQKGLGNSYALLSKVYHDKNDTLNGRYYANKAIEVFKANNFQLELGEAYFDMSGYYSFDNGELTERIRIAEELSLTAFQRAGSKKKEADVLKELADLRQIQGNYIKAFSDLKQALKIYQSINYPLLQGTYDLMGVVSADLGDYGNALKYGLLAVKTANIVNDTSLQLATIYNRIGITYEQLNNYEKANEHWKKGIKIAEKYQDTETIIILTSHLVKTLIHLHKPRESLALLQKIANQHTIKKDYLRMLVTSCFLAVYQELKQYEKAQAYCDEVINISAKFDPNNPVQNLVYDEVIPFYLATQQNALAQKYLAVNETYCIAINWPPGLSKNHLWWFKLDSALGNYQAAIFHYQRYKTIGDSLLNESTARQIGHLQVEYETEKKDQDIKLLENESKLQQGKLLQANQTRNWVLGVAALLLVTIGLLVNYSRLKQRTNKKLQVQQKEINQKNTSLQHLVKEKEWLVREIHHRVKNNFHIVMGLLGTQSEYLKTEEAKQAMAESQHRVHAMSLIHQKLYQSDNLSALNMADYIHELVDYLRDSFTIRQSIQFKLEIDAIDVELSHCIPLGLILNEAITNSIKYAFPGKKEGIIYISFKQAPGNHLLLTICDNGIGLPPGFNSRNPGSMGMKLMQGLSEDIDGKFSISHHEGTEIVLDFIYDPDSTIEMTQKKIVSSNPA